MSLLWPILSKAITCPRRTAVVDDRRRYTYAQLVGGAFFMAEKIAREVESRHVGVMLPTSGAFPIAFLGAWLAGKVPVPLNYLLTPDELAYVIDDSDIDTIITAGPMLDFLGKEDGIPAPSSLRSSGAAWGSGVGLMRMEEVDFTGFPEPRLPPLHSDDDLAVILYTSGTSGRPKGVMLSHGNLQSDIEAGIRHAGIDRADTFLGVLPQFHAFGLSFMTLAPLRLGATVVYSARFVPRKIVELIEKHRPDIMMAVPSMWGALLSVKGVKPDSFSSIRLPISGAEPLSDAIYEAYQDRFNLKILEGYGLTETSPATHWNTPEHNRRHSVGPPLPGVETYIVDEHDRVLGANQEGEILLAGPMVMRGYYKLDQQTHEVMMSLHAASEERSDEGAGTPGAAIRAFRTGDIGRVDEDGFLSITGRKKEMLIIGGENVFPREIEEVLNHHPAVKASAVIGKHDPMRGEVPIAFVELNDEATLEPSELRNHCRQTLAQYKVPREVRIVDELPRSPTGKIMRRKLRA